MEKTRSPETSIDFQRQGRCIREERTLFSKSLRTRGVTYEGNLCRSSDVFQSGLFLSFIGPVDQRKGNTCSRR
jgi:hypothetical protein